MTNQAPIYYCNVYNRGGVSCFYRDNKGYNTDKEINQ